jgi:hypothetical protein
MFEKLHSSPHIDLVIPFSIGSTPYGMVTFITCITCESNNDKDNAIIGLVEMDQIS